MNIIETALPGVVILEPRTHKDIRGFFMEMYSARRYSEAGIPEKFVQDNISSSRGNVVRGLHYQIRNPQGKLVSVITGSVCDVVVDIRYGSPHFGQWICVELNQENRRQIYVPPGFAHGFCSLSDDVLFHYKCTDYYHSEDEHGVLWSDKDIGVKWPVTEGASLSPKDLSLPLLHQISSEHLPAYSS